MAGGVGSSGGARQTDLAAPFPPPFSLPPADGALYTDEGSAYWLITKNVVHNVPEWLHIWTASIHDEVVVENWSDQTYQQNAGTRITEANSACALLPAARGGLLRCAAAARRPLPAHRRAPPPFARSADTFITPGQPFPAEAQAIMANSGTPAMAGLKP